jgi:hypothetical protein
VAFRQPPVDDRTADFAALGCHRDALQRIHGGADVEPGKSRMTERVRRQCFFRVSVKPDALRQYSTVVLRRLSRYSALLRVVLTEQHW